MNAISFGAVTRGRPGIISDEPKSDKPSEVAWIVLEAANDLGDNTTVAACRRVIDANLNGTLASAAWLKEPFSATFAKIAQASKSGICGIAHLRRSGSCTLGDGHLEAIISRAMSAIKVVFQAKAQGNANVRRSQSAHPTSRLARVSRPC